MLKTQKFAQKSNSNKVLPPSGTLAPLSKMGTFEIHFLVALSNEPHRYNIKKYEGVQIAIFFKFEANFLKSVLPYGW